MTRKRFLGIGELFFGGGEGCVETVLGSCVAITLWFPRQRLGGICHFQLPGRREVAECARDLDGRYGKEAWVWLKQQVRAHGLSLGEAEIKLFGGANSLIDPQTQQFSYIGRDNIDCALRLVAEAGARVVNSDLGGEGCRYLCFDLSCGEVWIRHGEALPVA
jgi:chemotaxis protein CheD